MEIIGNQKGATYLEGCIIKNKPVIVYGSVGVGKTYAVYKIAEEHGYDVIDVDIDDDLKRIETVSRAKTLNKILILFDDVDTFGNYSKIEKIIKSARVPVVLTATELWKLPNSIKRLCNTVKFWNPKKREIVDLLREKYGIKMGFRVGDDVRNSIISSKYGSELYSESDVFKEVEKVFKGEEFKFTDFYIWYFIIDNLSKYYRGYDLFLAVQIVCKAVMYNNPQILKCLPKPTQSGSVSYPFYLKKRRATS